MRVIVVVGGIISGVGKGITAASIAKILREYGFSVTSVKIDPYINFDAGTMRPTEHGEVWVTDDGGEIDQDLGNYERFLGVPIPKRNNITTGQVYWKVISDERKGRYLGQTVQFIPHIPNEIKRRVKEAGNGYDFVIVEVGGVVGDYENSPFLFAMKSLELELGRSNIAYVLVTYLPVPSHIGEMKTKPTQQAIHLMSEAGIWPDFVLCRAHQPVDDVRKKKIETYANIDIAHIISAPDVKSIYEVPLNFEKDNLGIKMLRHFGLQPKNLPDWKPWQRMVTRILSPSKRLRIAMVGKYVSVGDFQLADSYISVNQALEHAGAGLDCGVDIAWIDSGHYEKNPAALKDLDNFHGIVVPGGFGASGVEGKIAAIRHARENEIPYLGLCFGLQLATVEYARHIGMEKANSTEIDPYSPYPVIDIQPAQRELMEKNRYGGTMRLGAYSATLMPHSRIFEIYKKLGRLDRDQELIALLKKDQKQSFRLGIFEDPAVLERHRHRYEVNPRHVEALSKAGLIFSGWHVRTDGTRLMEFIELKNHPCFIATQAHPEFKSRLHDPAPMFMEFMKAASEQ
jgi:CTP synthase